MSKREDILRATEDLLWERGYESSSPRMILQQSGAGQGSLYHHFRAKKELAIEAMKRHEQSLMEAALEILEDETIDPLERVSRWLMAPRDAAKGCRLGRFAHERTVREDVELRRPLDRYLRRLHETLTTLLERAASDRGLRIDPPADELASLLLAAIQGGFVISQGTADKGQMLRVQRAVEVLLKRLFSPAEAVLESD